MHHSLVTVPAAAAVAMLYARIAASLVRPGLCRLLALAPVLALLLALPFAIPLYSARGFTAFFLTWLGEFKLLLLASGRGPLDPALSPFQFVFTGALPVKLLQKSPDDAAAVAESSRAAALPPLLSLGINFAVMVASLLVLRGKDDKMHPYMAFTIFGILIYCSLNFVLPCIATMGRALGMELEPQFDRPYLSASLQNFWGRRWNIMASAVLRATVYDPIRARMGSYYTGVLATFLVSGLMHEVIVYYLTFRAPTGQLTAFFVLHGSSVCAERWCARRYGARPPRVLLATPLVLAFVFGTAFWLFFPPLIGDGMGDRYVAEMIALLSSVVDAGGWAR